MCDPITLAAIAVGTSVVSSMGQASAANAQAGYQATADFYNADMTNMAADQTMTQAEQTSQKVVDRAMRFQHTQIAATAASGMAVTSVSAQNLQDRTEAMGRSDAIATLYSGISQATQLRAKAGGISSGATNMVNATYVSPMEAMVNGVLKAAPAVAGMNWSGPLNTVPAGAIAGNTTDMTGFQQSGLNGYTPPGSTAGIPTYQSMIPGM